MDGERKSRNLCCQHALMMMMMMMMIYTIIYVNIYQSDKICTGLIFLYVVSCEKMKTFHLKEIFQGDFNSVKAFNSIENHLLINTGNRHRRKRN